MREVIIDDKEKYLLENYPYLDTPEVTDRRRCFHCDDVFYVGYFKVFKDVEGNEVIYCPNAPECDGTAIDWLPVDDE